MLSASSHHRRDPAFILIRGVFSIQGFFVILLRAGLFIIQRSEIFYVFFQGVCVCVEDYTPGACFHSNS